MRDILPLEVKLCVQVIICTLALICHNSEYKHFSVSGRKAQGWSNTQTFTIAPAFLSPECISIIASRSPNVPGVTPFPKLPRLTLHQAYQYFNVDTGCVCVRHGCDVTSATYTLETRQRFTITRMLGASLLTVAAADMVIVRHSHRYRRATKAGQTTLEQWQHDSFPLSTLTRQVAAMMKSPEPSFRMRYINV